MNEQKPPETPPKPLPPLPEPKAALVYIPSKQVVEAAAQRLAVDLGMGEYAALTPIQQHRVRSLAIGPLVDAADHLVVSVLDHVCFYASHFGFSDALRDELRFAQQAIALENDRTVTEPAPKAPTGDTPAP